MNDKAKRDPVGAAKSRLAHLLRIRDGFRLSEEHARNVVRGISEAQKIINGV